MDMTLEEIRMQAMALGIKRTEAMDAPELIRAMRSAEGKRPCFNQRACCQPREHHTCAWRDDCTAQLTPVSGLVLSDNMITGYQVVHLLSSAYGWNMQVLRRDRPAYFSISEGHVDVVVADIDNADLGGLAVLAYTKRHWPAVITYAITRNEDAYIKQLAQDMGGCQAFFYLTKGKPGLDRHHGLAARIDERVRQERHSRPDPAPHPAAPAIDQAPALFTVLQQNRHSEERAG